MLERARAAMNAGELSRALSILDGYIDRFPHGAMAPEAAVLRIETLLKAGDRAAATRFANAFLAIAPHSPYAARVQSLLAASNP
jgi:outer membrane protein assembly factor BamD (BamD/ComL family)